MISLAENQFNHIIAWAKKLKGFVKAFAIYLNKFRYSIRIDNECSYSSSIIDHPLRVPLVRLYQEVDTFRLRAIEVSDQ